MQPIHTFWGYIFLLLLAFSFVGGIAGLVWIWRGNYFALAGKCLFSVVILVGVWMLLKFLTLPLPCSPSAPCG